MAKPESDAVKIYRISERHRTMRTTVIAAAIVVGIGIIALAVVKILDKPWWEVLIGTIGGTAVAIFGGQFGLFGYLSRRLRQYTRFNQRRVTELEQLRDPERTTSGLLEDGTNPPEDLP